MRRRFATRIAPDTHIEAVVAIKKASGPIHAGHRQILGRYVARYGLTSTLGSSSLFDHQWLVVTEHRVLLFRRKGGGLFSRIGALEHALDRTDVSLQWADFSEARLHKRLIHLTTTDQRMNISQTILGAFDEADLLVQSFSDRGRQIGLQEV